MAAADLTFRYTESGKTISILQPLVGKSGWLTLTSLTVTAFDTEDWLLFAGACDDGADLDPDRCQRLFSLPAAESQPPSSPEDPPARLRQDAQLFDEPDAHLHGSLQHALLSEFQHLVTDGRQILFATHSREMITRIDPSNILSIEDAGAKRLALAFDVYDTCTTARRHRA